MADDQFGVRMIYPTKSGTDGHTWFINSNGDNFDGDTANKGSDSSGTYYYFTDSQVRANTTTKYGYKEGDIEVDDSKIDPNQGGNGHMQGDEPTWRDVEITAYIFVTGTEDDECTWYCRGGRHSSSRDRCEGQAYKGGLHFQTGRHRFRKEQWHSSGYVSFADKAAVSGGLRNKWVGYKFICYNVTVGGEQEVKLEAWVDANNTNNWVQVNTYQDKNGAWGDGNHCNGVTNQALTWSAPYATFRWDSGSSVRFKKASVREITPSGTGSPPPTPGPPPPPGPTPTPTPIPPPPPGTETQTRLIYPSTGITAIGHNGNVPANINDQNWQTAWVYNGLPAWIKVDMQSVRKVSYCRIDFAVSIVDQTIAYNIETSLDNIAYTRVMSGTQVVLANVGTLATADFIDHNARFVRVNITSNSQFFNQIGIIELEVWGSDTPIGSEPPSPLPPPGIPPPPGVPAPPPPPFADSSYFYSESIHVFHINYSSSQTLSEDLCGTVAPSPNEQSQDPIEAPP